jgi:phosphohistidine phosphatase SixA
VEQKYMINLILMRHGEATPVEFGKRDFFRKLTEYGVQCACSVSQDLAGDFPNKIDLIITSAATRARGTAEKIQDNQMQTRFVEDEKLYSIRWPDLQNYLAQPDFADHKNILAVGHNPTWTLAASELGQQNFFMKPADAIWVRSPHSSLKKAIYLTHEWQFVRHFRA